MSTVLQQSYTDVLRLCGCAVLAALCLTVLRGCARGGFAGAVSACLCAVLAASAIELAVPVLSELRRVCLPFLSDKHAQVLFRAMAVGMTVQLSADTVRDLGEGGLADRVELAGRAVLLCIGLPLYEEILSMAEALLCL